MATALVNGVNINYTMEGEARRGTVVLVNGLADALDAWDFQVPALLAAGLRVLRFDNRGIGASDAPPGPYTSRLLADDAKALVDHLGLSDFHLVGVSMGGMVCQEYALAYGADLRSLTLACTYAAPGPFCSRMFDMWADLAPVLGVNFVMRDVTLWAFTSSFFSTRPEVAVEFEQAMASLQMSVPAYLSQLNVIQAHDAMSRLVDLAVPTLVLAGEEDILIPTSLSHELHGLAPGSTWATVPGGHACLWEYPEEFNAELMAFILTHTAA